MLETSNILVNKLTLNIRRSPNAPEQRNITDIVKSMIFHHICDFFQAQIDWHSFIWGGTFSSSDSNVNGIAASAHTTDGHPVWAASVYVKDKFVSRRRWKYYFGIRQHSEGDLSLSYAKCYYDHMAGSVSNPKPLRLSRDSFPDLFFFDSSIQCMCGKQLFPTLPLELNGATFRDFVDCIQDDTRSEPVILITCADYIVPEPLMDQLLGNAVIYWCDDADMISQLNNTLPKDMSTPWDSVHVFIPLSSSTAYHPVYTYDEIYHMGKHDFLTGMTQAYCRSMHHEERKSFLTVEDVNAIRSQTIISHLIDQRNAYESQVTELAKQLKQQTILTGTVSNELQRLKDKSYDAMIAEYEQLLNDTMSETDNLKVGISALTERLISTMGIGF